jgi:hypothetical protein
MAVTSCASAELIAVSSLLTFDVYKSYINPSASGSRLIFVSHVCICIFGLTMAVFACIWNAIGIDLGWLFLVMGLLIGGAVFPAAFAITWRKQSRVGAISGAIVGLCAGLAAWLATAKVYFGELTIASTGTEYATLAGNLAAIMTGLIITVVVSLIKPQNFDWEITRAINSKSIEAVASETHNSSDDTKDKISPLGTTQNLNNDEEKEEYDKGATPPDEHSSIESVEAGETQMDESDEDHPSRLRGAFMLACIASFVLTFIMDFLVCCPRAHDLRND